MAVSPVGQVVRIYFLFFKEEEGCPKGSIALRFTHSLSGVAASLLAVLDDDAFGMLSPVGS